MVSAVILAGGSGSRMKSKTAKQFMELGGKPLIYYALKTFEASIVDEIILVTRSEDIEFMKQEVVDKFGFTKVKKIVPGGRERYNSVWNGLKNTDRRSGVVLIHDGARPFVTNSMILNSIQTARRYKACTAAVPVKDTIKVVNSEGFGESTPDRNTLYMIQTPQTFQRELIMEAHHRLYLSKKTDVTDDTMIVEYFMDQPVKMIEGSYTNIKITTPEDLVFAEAILSKNF